MGWLAWMASQSVQTFTPTLASDVLLPLWMLPLRKSLCISHLRRVCTMRNMPLPRRTPR